MGITPRPAPGGAGAAARAITAQLASVAATITAALIQSRGIKDAAEAAALYNEVREQLRQAAGEARAARGGAG